MLNQFRTAVERQSVHVTFGTEPFEVLRKRSDVPRWRAWACDANYVWASGRIALLNNPKLDIVGSDSHVYLSGGASLDGTEIIVRGSHCGVFVGPRARLKRVKIHASLNNCLIIIGAGTTYETGLCICGADNQQIIIGDDCMFSNDVVIRSDDGHQIYDQSTGEIINWPKPVIIEHHVWLGNGSRVNKGARIGSGSVLGGMSVASGILEPHSVYAGIPARKVRGDIIWSRATFKPGDSPDKYAHGVSREVREPNEAGRGR